MTNDDRPSAPQPEAGDPTERALGAHLPGLRLVDRDLCLDGRSIADFVGLIAGRPVLFLAVEGDDEQALVRTAGAADFSRRHPDALARHIGSVGADGGGTEAESPARARTVLLSDTPFSPGLLERLAGLGEADLLVLQRRRLHSAVGESEFFVAVDARRALGPVDDATDGLRLDPEAEASPAGTPDGTPVGARAFLASLPAALAPTGRALVERIGRLDEEIECRALAADERGGGLEWLDGTDPLCSLRLVDGHLEARLAGSDVPHSIRTPEGVDVFLDWLLAAHLTGAGPPGDGGSLPEVELTPQTPGPILTPEEIEAFRD